MEMIGKSRSCFSGRMNIEKEKIGTKIKRIDCRDEGFAVGRKSWSWKNGMCRWKEGLCVGRKDRGKGKYIYKK